MRDVRIPRTDGLFKLVKGVNSNTFFISFYLFISGCPNSHFVVEKNENKPNQNILTDNCNKDEGDEWLAPKGAVDKEAEIVIHMGCNKKLKGLQMKNIKKDHGGTKTFTIYLSENIDGPWGKVFKNEFPPQETESCEPMKTFDFV